jgi:uncharacterized protein (UPF0212 family)
MCGPFNAVYRASDGNSVKLKMHYWEVDKTQNAAKIENNELGLRLENIERIYKIIVDGAEIGEY